MPQQNINFRHASLILLRDQEPLLKIQTCLVHEIIDVWLIFSGGTSQTPEKISTQELSS